MDQTIQVTGPNAEQIEFWNGEAASKWVDFNPIIDRMLGPLGLATMDRAHPRSGEHVLDVGCGCGDTTLELARRVAPAGTVTGVDISAPMLALARQRAADAAVSVHVVNADAETHALPAATFDLVYSRFGVMFFTNPDTAFGNLCAALKPGGRIAFVCWQALESNPWVGVPFQAAQPHLPAFEPPEPEDPGQFSLARPERVERILGAAGLADIRLDAHEATLHVGEGDLDACVALILKLGPVSRLLREAGEDSVPPVAAAVREAVAPYHTGNTLEMTSASWIVSARA